MASTKDDAIVVEGFGEIGTKLTWYCDPAGWPESKLPSQSEGRGGKWCVDGEGSLVVEPPTKKDFWRKTYYQPVLCKDDGPCLFATVASDEVVTMQTSFTLDPKKQFDQAGLCVRLDHEHWIKTGIECVDGQPRLSCVVTNVYSDWSTQSWPTSTLRIRLHRMGASYVVEAQPLASGDDEWAFIRICHLSLESVVTAEDPLRSIGCDEGAAAPAGHVWMGVFACCPEEQAGCTATFHEFSIVRGTSFEHNADGNHDDDDAAAL